KHPHRQLRCDVPIWQARYEPEIDVDPPQSVLDQTHTSRQESRRRGLLPVVSGWAIRTILVFKGRFFLASRWIPRRPSTCSDTCGRSADRRGRNTHWTLSGLKCEPTSRAPWVREPISSRSRTHRARSWVSGCAHRTNLAGSRRYGDI